MKFVCKHCGDEHECTRLSPKERARRAAQVRWSSKKGDGVLVKTVQGKGKLSTQERARKAAKVRWLIEAGLDRAAALKLAEVESEQFRIARTEGMARVKNG